MMSRESETVLVPCFFLGGGWWGRGGGDYVVYASLRGNSTTGSPYLICC